MACSSYNEGADLYAVLGVKASATAGLITAAFRARVRELRPDVNVDAGTAEAFGRLRTAYDTLRDPKRRAAYDRERAPASPTPARPVRRVVPTQVVGDAPRRPHALLWVGPVRWDQSDRFNGRTTRL